MLHGGFGVGWLALGSGGRVGRAGQVLAPDPDEDHGEDQGGSASPGSATLQWPMTPRRRGHRGAHFSLPRGRLAVGLAAAHSAQLLGAAVVIVGDLIPERLAQARSFGCETIDVSKGEGIHHIHLDLSVGVVF